MARRGRPRKSGKRTKSDRLSTAGSSPRIVRGNDRAEALKDRYGTDACDPIGRAYCLRLLGEGSLGKERLDNGRKFARIYRTVYPGMAYRCALDTSPKNGVLAFQTRRQRYEEEWIKDAIATIDNALRPYFDQLVLPANPDADPHWLADLMRGNDPRDRMILDAALRALDSISAPQPRNAKRAC